MTRRTIDLNCDLGELPELIATGVDRELLSIVTSANIACGSHAGDEGTMRQSVRDALAAGVALGAHPSYPDRANFGRVEVVMAPEEIEAVVRDQIVALGRIAREEGGELQHVKPHGALYHSALKNPDVARAIARAAATWNPQLILVAQAKAGPESEAAATARGDHALDVWQAMHFRVASEAFADRLYEPDGTLRARSREGAVLHDAEQVARQAVRIATGRGVITSDGSEVSIHATTLCLHGDSPGAVARARRVRDAIQRAEVRIEAL